ncbi:MAG: glycosyltransferase family 87 protein [Candidatus Binataceae bacterium]
MKRIVASLVGDLLDTRQPLEKRVDSRHARRLAWTVLAIYLGVLSVSSTLRNQGDYRVYYVAGERVLRGEEVYAPSDKNKFIYAPVIAYAFAPFALLPKYPSKTVWFLVNAAALLAFLYGSTVMLFGRGTALSAPLVFVPTLLSFRFIENNFHHGQINLLVLAAIVWSIVYVRENRTARGGALLGAAILVKPFALVAALYLMLDRRWRALVWTGVAIAALLVAPILLLGPERWVSEMKAYQDAVLIMGKRYRTMSINQSAVAAVARVTGGAPWGPLGTPAAIAMGFEMVMLIAVAAWIFRARTDQLANPWPLRFALAGLFCVMPSITPISWKSYYASLLVPYMVLTMSIWMDQPRGVRSSRAVWILIAISFAVNIVPTYRLNKLALFYSSHLISSLLVLAAVFAASRYASIPAIASQNTAAESGMSRG